MTVTAAEIGALVESLEGQRAAIRAEIDRLETIMQKTGRAGMPTAKLESQRAALQDKLGRVSSLIVTAKFVARKKAKTEIAQAVEP
jgi:hypothetical protein